MRLHTLVMEFLLAVHDGMARMKEIFYAFCLKKKKKQLLKCDTVLSLHLEHTEVIAPQTSINREQSRNSYSC